MYFDNFVKNRFKNFRQKNSRIAPVIRNSTVSQNGNNEIMRRTDSLFIYIRVKIDQQSIYLYVNRYATISSLDYSLIRNSIEFSSVFYTWNSILLTRNRSFINQCVPHGCTIYATIVPLVRTQRALSQMGLITPRIIFDDEMMLVCPRMKLQSGDESNYSFSYTPSYIANFLSQRNIANTTREIDSIINIMENLYILVNSWRKAKTYAEKRLAFVVFYKLCTNQPLFSIDRLRTHLLMLDQLFCTEVQSSDYLGDIRFCLDQYNSIKHTDLYKKMYKFIMFGLSASLFEGFGISFDVLGFTKISQEAIRKKYHMGPDFVYSMLDTITFLCERGFQCARTGEMSSIFHSSSTYEKWIIQATKLKQQSIFLTNPEPHGIDKFSYLASLNDTIEKGDAIYKHAISMGNFEKKVVKGLLNDLQMIKAHDMTKKAAQQERRAPFSLLLYGGTSIAKSLLQKILFYQYGKVFDLPIDDEFKYTRNPVDPYWVNFNSTQWFIQLDDIAFLNPNIAVGGDPSLMEMLQVINNVPYVPIQADLADKGRTPLMSRCVIASTNTENLNAYAYFSCPIAVRRRLPFVVWVTVKDEYAKNGMLDGAIVPEIEEGDYPNYWIFRVQKVVPSSFNPKDNGALELIFETDNIYDFLQWFSKEAILHETLQDKAMSCEKRMKTVVLCSRCHVPNQHCRCPPVEVQADDEMIVMHTRQPVVDEILPPIEINEISSKSKIKFFNFITAGDMDNIRELFSLFEIIQKFLLLLILRLYFASDFVRFFIIYVCGSTWMYRITLKHVNDRRVMVCIFRGMGSRVQNKIGCIPRLVQLAKATGVLLVAYKAGSSIYSYFNDSSKIGGEVQYDEEVVLSEQIGRSPVPVENERDNVWYKEDYTTTTFDVSNYTTSLFALPIQQVEEFLLRHCVYFVSTRLDVQGNLVCRKVRGTCVAGHIYMTNNHALPTDLDFDLEIISSSKTEGITPNIKIFVTQQEIHRFPDKDLAFINIKNIPPRRDITRLFCKDSLRGNFRGKYIGRTIDGSSYSNVVENINYLPQSYVHDLDKSLNLWVGLRAQPTELGDCGSLLLSDTPAGPVILGVHVLGDSVSCKVGVLRVTEQDVLDGINSFNTYVVQGGQPLLSSKTIERKIRSLDKKSPVRFTELGSANVYGSFEGFRQQPKTQVGSTFIQESILKRGYVLTHGPPVMKGWKPWYLALQDMVRPVVKLNMSILETCKENFIDDILTDLTKEDLSMVHVYDDVTAVNGAVGIAYVDKINRNTSAGNPWKKSKKFFITPCDPIAGLQDPVKVDKEIMDRVQICIETYERGERYMPNFCGHLKDEAVSFKKINDSETRVFTGAPFDWTIVNRKYLLSIVRLIQNKRYLFESAPGTVAQSTEWQDIYYYLTKHGSDRIIAGDYGKFDKRMPATVILAAFDIILTICKAAGYTDKELRVVQGIAEDTAFPLVDYNGDIIEFFGCNPSGHPLTVIINGLANSLYMRYCYAVLAPDKSAVNFKRDVSLMTYGDDNIMGVSPSVNFFNHTSIQKVLSDVDITYTMADKGVASIPFIHISKATFLKRAWRYDEDVGAFLCPLDHKSINKMLTVGVASKSITPQLQSVAVIETALREYFFYGRNVYEFKKIMFEEVVEENNLQLYVGESTFLPYEDLCEQFWENSKKVGQFEVQSRDIIMRAATRTVATVSVFFFSLLLGFIVNTLLQWRAVSLRRELARMFVYCIHYHIFHFVTAFVLTYIRFTLFFLPEIYSLIYNIILYLVFRD